MKADLIAPGKQVLLVTGALLPIVNPLGSTRSSRDDIVVLNRHAPGSCLADRRQRIYPSARIDLHGLS
jgi:hypothetical protein